MPRDQLHKDVAMKYARDAKPSLLNEQTAQVLFETLPWIKNLTGKVVVITM